MVITSLPTFAPFRYDPLVAMQWPQNQLSQAVPTLPQACQSCHTKGGSGGRLAHLSNELPGYCFTILTQAYLRTMPPSGPGSAQAAAEAFRDAYCNAPPNAASADAGDPHFTTVNGVRYDFQGAGEFVVLRDSDTGFEVQVRQSPIPTSFTPPANPHTGLASCASLNTAVAARIGKNRVTFQPGEGSERMEIRIDGGLIAPDEPLIVLGPGTSVTATPDGGLEARSADGTRLKVTPLFWPAVGVWYLDVNVTDTPAREGVMGTVLPDDWLPAAPDGSSFGPIPAALLDRHAILNGKFADAWRITSATSLFDYAIGTDTTTFTDPNWPPEPGKSCVKSPISSWPPRERMEPELAQTACRRIEDPGAARELPVRRRRDGLPRRRRELHPQRQAADGAGEVTILPRIMGMGPPASASSRAIWSSNRPYAPGRGSRLRSICHAFAIWGVLAGLPTSHCVPLSFHHARRPHHAPPDAARRRARAARGAGVEREAGAHRLLRRDPRRAGGGGGRRAPRAFLHRLVDRM